MVTNTFPPWSISHPIPKWSQSFQRCFTKIFVEFFAEITAYLVTMSCQPMKLWGFVTEFRSRISSNFYHCIFVTLFAEMSGEKFLKMMKIRPEISDFFRSFVPCDFFHRKIKNEWFFGRYHDFLSSSVFGGFWVIFAAQMQLQKLGVVSSSCTAPLADRAG